MNAEKFENIREIHFWVTRIRDDMLDEEKEKAIGGILTNMFELSKTLNTDMLSVIKSFDGETEEIKSFYQAALLTTMTNCLINLTGFLKDQEFSLSEYKQFMTDLARLGKQSTDTYMKENESLDKDQLVKIKNQLQTIESSIFLLN